MKLEGELKRGEAPLKITFPFPLQGEGDKGDRVAKFKNRESVKTYS